MPPTRPPTILPRARCFRHAFEAFAFEVDVEDDIHPEDAGVEREGGIHVGHADTDV